MVNAINNKSGVSLINNEATNTNQPQKTSSKAPTDHAVALKIKTLRDDVQTAEEINHSRVEFLKHKLASGEYTINSLVIADKLVNELQRIE